MRSNIWRNFHKESWRQKRKGRERKTNWGWQITLYLKNIFQMKQDGQVRMSK